jgi:hypothetical protein
MKRRMTEKPRLMPRKSALRVSDGPWTPSAPSLVPPSIAAKNATGMVSAKTLPSYQQIARESSQGRGLTHPTVRSV